MDKEVLHYMIIGNTIYNCASYERISKEDRLKGDESSSIKSQRMIIATFAKHNNLNIIEEYVDDGYSGGNFERPAFKRMIEDIKLGKINCVITKDLSRLGREMYKTGQYIEAFFLEHNVRYIAIHDSYDSSIGDSMLGLRLGVNDLYLREVSKKVRSTFRAKQEKGDYIGSFACYGYKKDPNNRHKLIIDTEAAKVVKRIYQLTLEGLGTTKICRKLTDEKIPIPIVHKKEPRGLRVTENDGYGIWKNSTVRSILKSQMYIGNMVQHTYEKVSYNNKKKRTLDEKEYIIVPNTHEPIIKKKDFDKVQEIIKHKKRLANQKNFDKYLFSDMIFCGKCGHTLGISERKIKSGVSRYTHCNNYLRKGLQSGCTPNRINYHLLEQDIFHLLSEIGEEFMKHYNIRNLVEESVYVYNKDIEEIEEKLKVVNNKLKKQEDLIMKMCEQKIAENMPAELYQKLMAKYSDEYNSLEKEKNRILEQLDYFHSKSKEKEFTVCRKAVENFLSLKEPSRSVLKSLISRIVVYDNGDSKEVKVYLRFRELNYIANKLA